MNSRSISVMSLWAASLCAGATLAGCKEEARAPASVSAANKPAEPKPAVDTRAAEAAKAEADRLAGEKAVAAKMAADKAAADKAIADKAIADKAAADKAIADKAAADKLAAEKAAGEKAAAEKAVAAKTAADKAAAELAQTNAKAEAASLPPALLETRAEIAGALAQMDLTMTKLDSLVLAKGELEKPSEAALASIQTLEQELEALKKRGDAMRDRGAAYFEAWEKQLAAMSTPEIVAMATKRKDELSAKYAEVLTAMQGTRSALDAYWDDMKSIQKSIEEKLTPETQKLLAPKVQAAKEKATTLKSRVEDTAAKLNQVSLLYTKP